VYPTIEPVSSDEDAQQIADLENHVKILKQQVITALDKVKKSAELESKILSLEEQVMRVNSTNVLNEGLRIGEIGRRMNSKVKSVKQGVYRK
jgi:hypothetical protein